MMILADQHADVSPAGGTFRLASHRADPESISSAILEAVAACTHRDVLDLDPLHEVVDPDALNDLFGPRPDGSVPTGVSVEFRYHGYDVGIDCDGTIRLRRSTDLPGE